MSATIASGATARDAASPFAERHEAVLAQLERIVESAAFCNSKRYPRFLRYIVEQTLLGRADLLKERLLAIEVFDRSTGYDPTTDPIVRVAAGEIRKRLAQYYVEHGHESELRIQLAPGSYVPEFHFLAPGVLREPTLAAETPIEEAHSTASAPRSARLPLWLRRAAAVAALALPIVLLALWVRSNNPIRRFWKPFLSSPDSPLLCLGDWAYLLSENKGENPALLEASANHDYLPLGDVEAMDWISSTLARAGKTATLASAHSTTFDQLCRRPVILIGGGPNPWTMREMKFLPLQLVRNFTPGINGILDRNHPAKLLWTVNFNQPLTAIPREYAIVARFHNPDTGQLTLIAAGVGVNGEVAAGEFLSTPEYLRQFIKHAPAGWQDRNLEIILETQMINGDSGPPHVIASRLW